jgi:hypothetical protein
MTRTLTFLVAFGPLVGVIAGAAIYLHSDVEPREARALVAGSMNAKTEALALAGSAPGERRIEVAGSSDPPSPTARVSTADELRAEESRSAAFPHRPSDAEAEVSTTANAAASENQSAPPAPSRTRNPAPILTQASAAALVRAVLPAASTARALPLPLAFADLDPSASGLTDGQANLLDSLREDFVRDIGGPRQNPGDPRYAARWRALQPSYDQRLRVLFGAAFVEQLQLQAAQADYAAAHAK